MLFSLLPNFNLILTCRLPNMHKRKTVSHGFKYCVIYFIYDYVVFCVTYTCRLYIKCYSKRPSRIQGTKISIGQDMILTIKAETKLTFSLGY